MRGAPGAQRRGGLVSRIDVDEDSPVRFQSDRQLEPEVMPGLRYRYLIHPQGKVPAFDPERLEGTDLLRLGRQPGQAGMLQHVVEREQAPEENFRRSHPAVADVLGTQSLEDRPAEEPAHFPFLQAVFGGKPVGDRAWTNRRACQRFIRRWKQSFARVKRPPLCRQTRAIHSAFLPVQPNGCNPFSRSLRCSSTR